MRFELKDVFFEDEIREGFYIPSAMKKAWGAQLQILNELDRVCAKLGIRYFATWGTYLGALRHGGYVPWDDDLDVCMLRDDYIRFINEGVPLLSEGYEVFTHSSKADHIKFVANMVANAHICFDEEHLSKFHGFPYIAAVDVFQYDYMPKDEKEYERYRLEVRMVLAVSDEIINGKISRDELDERIEMLMELIGIDVPKGLEMNEVRQFLDIKAEEMFASYVDKKEQTEMVTQAMPVVVWDDHFYFVPSYYYSAQVELSFEMGKMPVPLYYLPAMRHHYRDYMKVYRGTSAHGYPFFAGMEEELKHVQGINLPEYHMSAAEIADRRALLDNDASETYRSIVCECLDEMGRGLEKLGVQSDSEGTGALCNSLQQLAIDLGTYMEAIKGEKYDIVAMLEEYCEALYKLVQDGSAEGYILVKQLFDELSRKIKARKEIIFLPFKGEYWRSFETEYRKWAADPDADVYVIPIPYYYKDYLGQLYDMQYDISSYPSDLPLMHYEEYDYALRHPDRIYIQNPYDQWNEITSVPPFFYSDKLLAFADKLVYIPWFQTYDFSRKDALQYYNMRYYCNMPGVINADEVILQSEMVRESYIEKLCEFAGEETRELWENKLKVAEEKNEQEIEKEEQEKTLFYYQDFSEILFYGQKAIDKVLSVVEGFRDSIEYQKLIIVKSALIDDMLKKHGPEIYDEYTRTLERVAATEAVQVLDEKEIDLSSLIEDSAGFIGDAGRIAHLFNVAGKPVEIQEYE